MTDCWTLVMVTAVLGAALSAAGDLAYLRDMRAGRTIPHRGAWLVWTVIAVIAAASHGASGGRWSLLVMSAQALGCLLVLGCAIRGGVGGLTAVDLALLALAGLGVVAWLALSNPLAACCGAVLADAAGLAGVVPKIWHQPHSETPATYALAGASGLLCALTAGSTDPAVLVFPLYFFVANAVVARLITVRRRSGSYRSGVDSERAAGDVRGDLGPGAEAQFGEHPLDVTVHRARGNDQGRRDVPVGHPLGDQVGDLQLSAGEHRQRVGAVAGGGF
jgi:hypothetical protein